jgi:2-oxoglutarate ferredoxin oxidoreductase subunit delta
LIHYAGRGPQPNAGGRAEIALEDAMAKGTVKIDVERCKACGFCVEFCPSHVLALSSAFNSKGYHPPHAVDSEKCSGCDLCGMYCPDFAIYGYKTAQPGKPETKKNEG